MLRRLYAKAGSFSQRTFKISPAIKPSLYNCSFTEAKKEFKNIYTICLNQISGILAPQPGMQRLLGKRWPG